jgi:phosphate transport system protein
MLLVVIAISAELERIGDYAVNIARRVNDTPALFINMQPPADFATLTTMVRDMLHASITAFVEQNLDQARALAASDEQVDALHAALREQLIARIAAAPQETASATDVLDMVHLLERTADRAENIGERVIYLITRDLDAIQ